VKPLLIQIPTLPLACSLVWMHKDAFEARETLEGQTLCWWWEHMYLLNTSNSCMYVQILYSFDEEINRVLELFFTLTAGLSFFLTRK